MAEPTLDKDLQASMALAFAPIHKRALGVAAGLTFGTLVAFVTMLQVLLQPEPAPRLDLLANYFYGYTVSPAGAAIGFAWAFLVGFVAGWFLAFVRNLATALWIFFVRAKSELTQNFLDHI
ncbi:MAG: hypothetical protein AB7H96_14575 [Vicinamibacterales bacterium]